MIEVGIQNKLTKDKMPNTFLVVSDMQFDSALRNCSGNNYKVLEALGGNIGEYFKNLSRQR